jgi:tetratricopeptide (TPR) repeat protein
VEAPKPTGSTAAGGVATADAPAEAAVKELEARIEADRKNASERIDERMDGAKTLLDKLITLVGVYSVILGITAFITVKFARDEAKEEIENYRKKIESIEQEYQQNFPEFTLMDARIQQLLREMELHMPSMDDWNDDDSFRNLREVDRQYITDSELTIAAISVFALDRSPRMRPRLVSIYSIFARFYAGRDHASDHRQESDFVRALSYATRVVKLSPESSAGYRQRGAIYLARYQRLVGDSPAVAADTLEQVLKSAETDLAEAIGKGTDDAVDAGAYYNRALLSYYKGDIEAAVTVSRRLLGLRSKITSLDRERYLPYIYQNLGCFLALLAQSAASKKKTKAARQLGAEAVQALTSGIEDFKITEAQDGGLARLKKGIASELGKDGDLSKLREPFRQQVAALLQ